MAREGFWGEWTPMPKEPACISFLASSFIQPALKNGPQLTVSPTLEVVVPSRAVIALANLTQAQYLWLLLCAPAALPGAV